MPLVIGAHPQNLSLSILSRRPDAVAALRDRGLTVFVYGAGSQTIPLVRSGVLHLAGTGATPPILAKAAGLPAAVFAIGPPRPERGGLLVAEDSPFHSLHDLAGRGIGLMPVSWHTQFLAAELAAAGLHWRDVRAAEIVPATARDAFLAGLLDAIVATDPLYSEIAARRQVRALAAPGPAFSNRTAFWAPTRILRDHPEAVRALLDALVASERATAADPGGTAELLDGLNGHAAAQWLPVLASRPWGIDVPGPDFLAEQQAHADLFAAFGLIPATIDVADTVDPRPLAAARG
ncbi:Putative aliphatic sulfonates-binding protein [Methylobacterium crusticola]|uniref:Aliphatic sulfonates-binding protein n=1 Tax=Methylobacterium crusticola TaxID=1697972 RepID=A0ABQ4QVS5_9HYPH|nr:ABC transporter substrate-binding protein [Methylobacterium crusticola]GJD48682.1 Putative aliphatic sulfonates-binding protein [Methylobacterium crusticola]